MSTDVETIKKKVDIIELINRFVPLKKRGRHHVACCPFHSEKTPSFIVSPELQIFKCFGCGKSGDIFTFMEEYHRLSFSEALEELAKITGVTLTHSTELTQADRHQKQLLEINELASRFYHYLLVSHPLGKSALDYVLGRGLKMETIKLFRLGFSPPDSQLILNFLTKKGFSTADLIATGTFGQSQYGSHRFYDRFQDRLIFPLVDYRHRILGFSGRVLPGAKKELAKYINSPETPLYHKSQLLFGLNLAKDAIRTENAAIIVEGEFDMISPYQSGIHHIVAIKGTAFTLEQLQLLKRYTDTLILGLDSDFAGNNAAKKSIELADSLDFDIRVIDLQDRFKDPDEAVTHDPDFFQSRILHAVSIWDFLIRSAVKNYGTDSVRGKKQILAEVLPFIQKITNSVIRSDYIKKLSLAIDSDESAITEELAKTTTQPASTSSPSPAPSLPGIKIDSLEEYLLSLVLICKKPPIVAKKVRRQLTIQHPGFSQLMSLIAASTNFNPATFSAALTPELTSLFETAFLRAGELNYEPLRRSSEIKKTVIQILSINLKNQLQSLGNDLAKAEKVGDEDSLTILEKEYNSILTKLSHLQAKR